MQEINRRKFTNNPTTISILFKESDLFSILIQKQKEEALSDPVIEHITEMHFKMKKKDNAKKRKADFLKIANVDNLIHSNFGVPVVNDGDIRFNPKLVDFFNFVEESGDVYDLTLSENELTGYYEDIKRTRDNLKEYQRKDDGGKNDIERELDKGIKRLFGMMYENKKALLMAIKDFNAELTKDGNLLSLSERRSKASELMKRRVLPFQNFLNRIHNGNPISDIVDEIIDILKINDLNHLILDTNNCSVFAKNTNGIIAESNGKLDSVIKSSRKRIEMLEYSSAMFKSLCLDLEESKGVNLKKRKAKYFSTIENFTLVDNNSIENYIFKDVINYDFLMLNQEFVFDHLKDMEHIIKPATSIEINESKKNIEASNKNNIAMKKDIEATDKIKKLKRKIFESKKIEKEVLNGVDFDIFNVAIKGLDILEIEYNSNAINGVVRYFIKHFQQKHNGIFQPTIKIENQKHRIIYNCFTFKKILEK